MSPPFPSSSSPLLHDAVAAPLHAISSLFQQSGCPVDGAADFGVPAFFAELCQDAVAVPRFNYANLHSLPNNSLVRLQGTVQDLPNPELYLGVAKLPNGALVTSKFSDGLPAGLHGQHQQVALWDRRPMVLTRPPISPWVQQQQQQQQAASGALSPSACQGSGPSSRSEEVLVYLYDQQGAELMLHDLVEVVGVLSKPQDLCSDVEDIKEQMSRKCSLGDQGPSPSPSLESEPDFEMDAEQCEEARAMARMIRVHAVLLRKQPAAVPVPELGEQAAHVPSVRGQAIQLLSGVLGGDVLAAEYLLMLTLQRVTARGNDMQPMGITSLNISRCPDAPPAPAKPLDPALTEAPLSPFAEALLHTLSALLPLTCGLPLSISACNQPAAPWVPCHTAGLSRVSRSPLQLPPGTMLLLDETLLREGKLEQTGLQGLKALAKVLKEQVLEYDFDIYNHSLPVEVPALVLSTGRSILREAVGVQLPLHASAAFPSTPDVQSSLDKAEAAGQLDPIRCYLLAAAHLPYDLTEDTRQMLVEEFVACRQRDPGFGGEEFQVQLTLARACALSFGEAQLSAGRWEYLKQLEVKRQARLRVV